MKHWILRISMVFVLALLMSVTVFAEGTRDGLQDATGVAKNVDIKVTAPDQLSVTYEAAEVDAQYLVVVTDDKFDGENTTLNADNIYYIDQDKATETSITFSVYPKSMAAGTYRVWLSSNAANGINGDTSITKVAEFKNVVSVVLGDVDANGRISTGDATQTLQHAVKKITLTGNAFTAADVTKDGRITTGDATKILQYAVKKITSFD